MIPWLSRSRREEELDEEIRTHLRMAVEERVARGESRPDAERAVRREFGNVGHVKEVTRLMWGGMWLDRLSQDLTFAVRQLRRTSPTRFARSYGDWGGATRSSACQSSLRSSAPSTRHASSAWAAVK